MKSKNKIFLIIFYTYLFLTINQLNAENIEFKANEIRTFQKGEIIIGEGKTEVLIDKKIKIVGDKYTYYKLKNLLILEKNIQVFDIFNNIKINSQLIHYDDIKSEIISFDKTFINLNNEYKIISKNIHYLNNEKIIYSDERTSLTDNLDNKTEATNFNYSINDKIIKGKQIKHFDNKGNTYLVTDGMVNVQEKLILGKDISVFLRNNIFGSPENEPRLKGNVISYGNNRTVIKKGVFTTCKSNKSCTPWSIKSKNIMHDSNKKEIRYEKAWLNIYDMPVLYFPKFFHPDPTVKRKSGFLTPRFTNSKILGTSVTLPYFQAIADNSDITWKPKIFNENEILFHSEYRLEQKNSSHVFDFSLNSKNKTNSGTETHFFSNSKYKLNTQTFDDAQILFNIQKVSNDEYINLYSLENNESIVNDTSILENLFEISASKDNLFLDLSIESYETLNKPSSDRYEYVYPNYNISNIFEIDNFIIDSLNINSTGNQKKYSTNIHETVQINDVIIASNEFLSNFGFKNNFEILLKNVNSWGKNSSKFKEKKQAEIFSLAKYDLSLPLIKENQFYKNFLTPKLSLMHSPNDGKNLKNENRKLSIDNAFDLNRIGFDDSIEGGTSLTLGLNFENKNNEDLTKINSNIATVFRKDTNENLPLSQTLGKKQSDIVGNIDYFPNKIIDIKYDYSISNDLNEINFHNLETNLKINNFVNTFTFYEENNLIGDESYYQNKISYNINPNNFLVFQTRENKKTNLTEFYDLIYEYRNDCLVASLRYNKEYYNSSNIKPNEQLFFNITLIPLGSTKTENILN